MIFEQTQTAGLSNGIITNAATKLNNKWNIATLNSALILTASTTLKNGSLIGVYMTTINIVAPTILKKVWNMAVCLAVLELPIEAIQEVIQVPMFAPTTRHNALSTGSNAPEIKKTTIEVTTDDDWTMSVIATAIATKISGLLVELNITLTSDLNDSFSMLACNNCKPMNNTPNPATI